MRRQDAKPQVGNLQPEGALCRVNDPDQPEGKKDPREVQRDELHDEDQHHDQEANNHEDHQNDSHDRAAGQAHAVVVVAQHFGELVHDRLRGRIDSPADERVRQCAEELHQNRTHSRAKRCADKEQWRVQAQRFRQVPARLLTAGGADELRDEQSSKHEHGQAETDSVRADKPISRQIRQGRMRDRGQHIISQALSAVLQHLERVARRIRPEVCETVCCFYSTTNGIPHTPKELTYRTNGLFDAAVYVVVQALHRIRTRLLSH
ncbi:hypothetical protein E3O65_07005 [Cryobacterium breve]|uniref:Uncharacterized protein n=1 Tax=Cryobacterium breve TaxID=1259258 RepID=A0ABY2J2B0_9MICO|nr:hypothetical protein E3T20_11130 [Cryobacterium sp. TmT3-12]TFC98879.1 hypothetical protein E3O65_07005 [Cryobacterium breve]